MKSWIADSQLMDALKRIGIGIDVDEFFGVGGRTPSFFKRRVKCVGFNKMIIRMKKPNETLIKTNNNYYHKA